MPNTMTGTQRTSRYKRCMEWLRQHPQLDKMPGAHEDMTDEGRELLKDALAQMQALGLYSRKVQAVQSIWGMRVIIADIKKHG